MWWRWSQKQNGAYDRSGKGGDGGGLQVVGENGTGALGGRGWTNI